MAAASPAQAPATIPPVSKEIQKVAVHVGSLRHYLEVGPAEEGAQQHGAGDGESLGPPTAHGSQRVHIEAGKGRRMVAYADEEVMIQKK